MPETIDTGCRFYYDLKTRRRLTPGSADCRRNLARQTSLCDQCGQAPSLDALRACHKITVAGTGQALSFFLGLLAGKS